MTVSAYDPTEAATDEISQAHAVDYFCCTEQKHVELFFNPVAMLTLNHTFTFDNLAYGAEGTPECVCSRAQR